MFFTMFVKKDLQVVKAISCEFAFCYIPKLLIYLLNDPENFFAYENKNTQNFTLITNLLKYLEKEHSEKVICQKVFAR
jgi:hypothetical protein